MINADGVQIQIKKERKKDRKTNRVATMIVYALYQNTIKIDTGI